MSNAAVALPVAPLAVPAPAPPRHHTSSIPSIAADSLSFLKRIAGVAGAKRPREQCARVDEERPRQRPRSSTDADLGKKPAAGKEEVIDLTG